MSTIWIAFGIFVLFNIVGVAAVLLTHQRRWKVDLAQYRSYTTLVFNVCGVLYGLFVGFIVWDTWERYSEVKQDVYNEAKYLTDLYRDATLFPEEGEETIQGTIRSYLNFVAEEEWPVIGIGEWYEAGDLYVTKIWSSLYVYTPSSDKELAWYEQSIENLSRFSNARLTRVFNSGSSVGWIRWGLLIFGGVLLTSISCFFKVDFLAFKLILTLFLANIIGFMLFITFSLDHPFTGHHKISNSPFKYAVQVTEDW